MYRSLLRCPRYPPHVVSGLVLEIVPSFTAGSDRVAPLFYGGPCPGYDPRERPGSPPRLYRGTFHRVGVSNIRVTAFDDNIQFVAMLAQRQKIDQMAHAGAET